MNNLIESVHFRHIYTSIKKHAPYLRISLNLASNLSPSLGKLHGQNVKSSRHVIITKSFVLDKVI